MRFYADENFRLAVVTELRVLGHDVLTALEDARANQKIPDDAVLDRAIELDRAVLTINRIDFRHDSMLRIKTMRESLYALLTRVSSDSRNGLIWLAAMRRGLLVI